MAPAEFPKDRSEYPKVARRNGVTCIQTLGDDDVVREDCRTDTTSYSGAATRNGVEPAGDSPRTGSQPTRSPEEAARSTVVADFAALGTLGVLAAAGTSIVLPGFGAHLSVGGRTSDTTALGGMLNAQFAFGPGGVLIAAAFAPALRLGDRGHVTLALGPSILYAATTTGTFAGLTGTFLVHGVIPISGGFGLHGQLGVTFDQSGFFAAFSLGFGGSVF